MSQANTRTAETLQSEESWQENKAAKKEVQVYYVSTVTVSSLTPRGIAVCRGFFFFFFLSGWNQLLTFS